MERIYLDYSATTPMDERVFQAMQPYFSEIFGNPSSIHREGQQARNAVEEARSTMAKFLQVRESEIFFTGSGTEADNLALQGVLRAIGKSEAHIITTRVEHKAVLETCHFLEKAGYRVTYLPVNEYGQVDPREVRQALTPQTILVSIIHGNNEVGTLNPLAEIGQITREAGVLFHTDAVQTFGKLPIHPEELGVDLLSASAHKIYGPKGVGLLYIRRGVPFSPVLFGGGQERNRRPGTENVPGIVGFARAVELCSAGMKQEREQMENLRQYFLDRLYQHIPDIQLNGHPEERLPHVLNLSFRDCHSDTLLLNLDMAGIAASGGSACSSGTIRESHVLKAMGIPKWRIRSAIRFSLGRNTTREAIDRTVTVLQEIVQRIRKLNGKNGT